MTIEEEIAKRKTYDEKESDEIYAYHYELLTSSIEFKTNDNSVTYNYKDIMTGDFKAKNEILEGKIEDLESKLEPVTVLEIHDDEGNFVADDVADDTVRIVDEESSKFNSLIRTCNEEVLNYQWSISKFAKLIISFIILSECLKLFAHALFEYSISIYYFVGMSYLVCLLISLFLLFYLVLTLIYGWYEFDEVYYEKEFTVS